MATQCPKDFNDELPNRIAVAISLYHNMYPLLILSGFPPVPPNSILGVISIDMLEEYLTKLLMIVNLIVDTSSPITIVSGNLVLDTHPEMIVEMIKLTCAYSDIRNTNQFKNSLMNISHGGKRNTRKMKGGADYSKYTREQLVDLFFERDLQEGTGVTKATVLSNEKLFSRSVLIKALESWDLEHSNGGTGSGTLNTAVSARDGAAGEESLEEMEKAIKLSIIRTDLVARKTDARLRGEVARTGANNATINELLNMLTNTLRELHTDVQALGGLSPSANSRYHQLAEAHTRNQAARSTTRLNSTSGAAKNPTELTLALEQMNLSDSTSRLIETILATFTTTQFGSKLLPLYNKIVIQRNTALNSLLSNVCKGCVTTFGGAAAGAAALRVMLQHQAAAAAAEALKKEREAILRAQLGFLKWMWSNMSSEGLSQGVGAIGTIAGKSAGLTAGALCGACGSCCNSCFTQCVGVSVGTATQALGTASITIVGGVGTAAGLYTAYGILQARAELLQKTDEMIRNIDDFLIELRRLYLAAVINKYHNDVKALVEGLRDNFLILNKKDKAREFLEIILQRYSRTNPLEGFAALLKERKANMGDPYKNVTKLLLTLEPDDYNNLLARAEALSKSVDNDIGRELVKFHNSIQREINARVSQFTKLTEVCSNAAAGAAGALQYAGGIAASNAASMGLANVAGRVAGKLRQRMTGSTSANRATTNADEKAAREEERARALAQAREDQEHETFLATLAAEKKKTDQLKKSREAAEASAKVPAPAHNNTRPPTAEELAGIRVLRAQQAQQRAAAAASNPPPAASNALPAASNALPAASNPPPDASNASGKAKEGGKRKTRRSKLNKRKTRRS